MKNTTKWEMGTKIAKLSIVVAAVYLGMKFIFPIALPFLIALVFARILYPLTRVIEKKTKLGRNMSRSLTYGIFLFGVGILLVGILYLCYRMGSNCLDHLTYFLDEAKQMFGRCCDKLEQISGISTNEIQRTITREAAGITDGAVEYSKDAGWYMVKLLAKILVTFVATFLILNDYEKIVQGIKKTVVGKRIVTLVKEVKVATGAYLRAQLSIIGLVTAICIVGLFLQKMQNALWIGLAIGLCDALPFLGTGTVLVPWALIELLFGRYKNTVVFLCIFIICSFVRQILEPRLVGRKIGVPPLAVLMSIYIGIQVYGGVGVILGPVSALIIYEVYHWTGGTDD